MKSQGWLGAVCIVLVSVAAQGVEEPRRIGRLGEPSRWAIEGAKTFTPDEIRAALFDSFDVAAACEKDGPLDALTDAIVAKTIAGYHQAGFADAKVTIAADSDRITATIDEGDRYAQGEVRLQGNRAVDGARIRDALTRPSAAKKRALWSGDEPASFNAEFKDWLINKVAELAGEQGFYRASFNVSVTPDKEMKKGTLDIEIIDEGPRATLSDVKIEAGANNPAEKVLAYLELDARTPLTRELREQVVRQLLRSGRFLRAQWELGEANKRDEAWRPCLTLKEYEQAPPLDAPLTREEAALLKLAEWIERFDESDEEILLRFPGEHVSMILAPRHGYILEYQPSLDAGSAEAGPRVFNALVMAEERVGLYSAPQRGKIDAAPPPAPFIGNAEITLITGGSHMDGRGQLTFGAGLRRSSSSPSRHIDIKLKLTAAAALSVVRTHHAKVAWDGDVVCFEWKYRQMRVNASTGQLLEQIVHKAIDGDGKTGDDNSFVPHITIGAGQFSRRLAEIEKLTADWPNAADGQRPLSCIGEFLCQELQHFDADSKSGYAAVGKLVSQGLLRPFDELTAQLGSPEEDHFIAPQRYLQFHFNSVPELSALVNTLSRAWGISMGNVLFPRDGWTQAIWRDGVFLLADKRSEASDDLSRQPADGRGPLCALAAAEILHAAALDQFAPLCARRGLRRLSLADFRDDCRDLLDGRGFASQCLLQAVAAARQINAADIQAIADLLKRFEVLDDSQASFFALCAGGLRGDAQANPSQMAVKAIDVLWNAGLKALVEQRLKALAAPPAPAALPAFVLEGNEPYGATTAEFSPPSLTQNTPPEPVLGSYGVAPPGTTLDRYGRPLGEQTPATPTEPKTSVEDEVRELKWLAMALTDRLTNLEERLNSGAQNDSNAAKAILSEPPAPFLLGGCGLPFFLGGPAGVKFDPGFPNPPHPLPAILQVGRDQVSSFRIVGVEGHENERLDLVICTAANLPEGLSTIVGDGVPMEFKEADLNAALAGRTVTTVVLYVEDAKGKCKIETLTSVEDRAQEVSKASRRGVVLAVVSMSNEAWRYLPEGHSTAKAERPNDSAALDGFCPVSLVEQHTWQKGDAKFVAVHGGKTYRFASDAAQEVFMNDPDRYTPAFDGNDPVLAVDNRLTVPGRCEHGAVFNGRVYLFSDEQTLHQFESSPEHYLGSKLSSINATPPGAKPGGRAPRPR